MDNTRSETQKLYCDDKITQNEVKRVIDCLKTEKSPGSDGLTPEFYKTFWPLIKDLFMNMIQETFEHGELPYSMRKALLALLYKKGDITLLKNYRPISLTNYDYKIICFTLTNRLQKVIKSLVHEDQTGYIKGRYIGTNARLIQDYFEHCENFKVPGILLFLDFEKAFDSIEWNFMLSVLEKFNFGKSFISWIKILYNKPTLSIKNNGWISKDIKLSRGVRQGCPLSALLFVLSVEIMAIKIRNNKNINGFQCGDKEIKTSMYADDASLLLSDLISMKNAIDTVNEFSEVAGPKLNKDKTEGILLGPLKNSIPEYETIKFTNGAVRCLGVYVGHNKLECDEKNWTEKINKMEKVFERWKHRHLTLFGKVLIIKTLAASKLIHAMTILHTPDNILKDIEKLIFSFLWESTDRIKRKTLIGSKQNGGIKMLDIFCKNKALKASWVPRLINGSINSIFINSYLNKLGINLKFLFKCNCSDIKQLKRSLKLPLFWVEVFAFFNECKSVKENKLIKGNELLSEPIWLNKRFQHNDKPIFLSNWLKSGIIYVKDLFDINGIFISENYIYNNLIDKRNWIAQYSIVKDLFKKIPDDYSTINAKFVNIIDHWTLIHNNKVYNIINEKSKFFYDIFVDKKFERNYMESTWEKEFNIEKSMWKKIYQNQIWIADKKVGEFKYKIICNILSNKALISKWNQNITENCDFCGLKHTTKHLLYECPRVSSIWDLVSDVLKLNVTYKHIVIGNVEENEFIYNRNLLITYISYSIYKHWIQSQNDIINFNTECLLQFIKKDIFSRTIYVKNHEFRRQCDYLLSNI